MVGRSAEWLGRSVLLTGRHRKKESHMLGDRGWGKAEKSPVGQAVIQIHLKAERH